MKKAKKAGLGFASLILASSLNAAKWKNGGGVTYEIAVHPEGSSLERANFLWRMSSAEVTAPGPFSLFPDFDRLLTLVTGGEIVLKFPKIYKSLKPGMVLHFHGSEQVEAELPTGPVKDLGFIYDADQVLAKMTVIELKQRPRSFSLTSPVVLFHALEGEIAAQVYPGEAEYGLCAGDTLKINPHIEERVVHLDPGKDAARLVAVEVAVVSPKSSS